jgi:hypothetical protein
VATVLSELVAQISAVPAPVLAELPATETAIAASIAYLGSDAAAASLAIDAYWPKWDSPWWHMLALFELGAADRIPARATAAMVDALRALPLKVFPIWPGDLPAGADQLGDVQCHCALGSIHQVLAACGVSVPDELPWIEPWFVRYQMADGGLNCDEVAYRQTHECASSMVATVAPLEAMLVRPRAQWSAAHAAFVARATQFLIGRRVSDGSTSAHNAEERDAAPRWRELCFPRLYLYDVLRGLAALTRAVEITGELLPVAAVVDVVQQLCARFPDGVLRPERHAYAGVGSRTRAADGTWLRGPASLFPALVATSELGAASPALTRQWAATRARLARLADAGQLR